MAKVYKVGKVVLVVQGRFAGRKAVILKIMDEPTPNRPFGSVLVVGVDRYPRNIHKRMGKTKIHNRCKIKAFIKVYNVNHIFPTRYSVNLPNNHKVSPTDVKDPTKRKVIRFRLRMELQESYKQGQNRWFFQKLRF